MKTIAVLPGDGIGPEVVDTVLPVIDRMGLPLEFRFGEVGWTSWCEHGDAVPPRTWKLLDETDTCLLGAITSKPVREAEAELAEHLRGTGLSYVSPVVQLRQRLSLYANVRPVADVRADRFAFSVIRENTEGLYAGLDFHGLTPALWDVVKEHPNAAASGPEATSATLRLQTRFGVDRLLRFGFEHARANGYRRLTLADKPNVLRASSNALRGRLELIAAEYPDVEPEILNVDAVALWMVRRPERFGVVIAENMFGDILSDLGAGVMGGLGLAPSGNIGEHGSYFEPVHGSAPAMAGQHKANPMALFLTVSLLLRHLELPPPAEQIRAAVRAVARARRAVTYDLGGTATTEVATAAVESALAGGSVTKQASVIAVGDELLSGKVSDTNSTAVSRILDAAGYQVRSRATVGDTLADIQDSVRSRIGADDVIVVLGGLGPTSDDVTRDAVASACDRPLAHDETAWQAVCRRLESFGLTVHEDNRRQALFPAGSRLLPNENGSAWGARVDLPGTTVLMLPGPPKECLPMAEAAVAELPAGPRPEATTWRLLGVIEGDIAADVDAALAPIADHVRVSYLWNYPYVDVTVTRPADGPELPADVEHVLGRHTVSRSGRDALAELATKSFKMSTVDMEFGGDRFQVNGTSGPELAIRGRSAWSGGPTEYSGTLTLTAEVTVHGTTRTFELAVPKRGPEVADYAAAFYAWSAVRALDEGEQ
ncbi:isocitrate/isopropylmalate family dehydrogenase [Kutzneria sp. CA-103260]|uniref:isocitrate/isopropylmalate family dehydrogenase n=1 Tax=Kutzneria sp. CA-103260 TaxID=2802641 RepID=UPI001BADF3CF|nr:isocitrate/isopropylmalate family dehydrogenase [Kutzneria sp. CA-103260]QUQ72004.1 3-isopropylmalate dehydrogenase [Kutzneria sp. CA-103260]